MASEGKSPLRGSYRGRVPEVNYEKPYDGDEKIRVTVRLRRKKTPSLWKIVERPVSRRKYFTSERFAEKFGVHPEALCQIRKFATAAGLKVDRVLDAASLCVLEGSVAQFCAAFGVVLYEYPKDDQLYRSRVGTIQLPKSLTRWVLGIHGLDNRPQSKRRTTAQFILGTPEVTDVRQLARLYTFPEESQGAGQTIALIHFGQGYLEADLRANFSGSGQPVPEVTHRDILNGRNEPFPTRFEPTLDMVVAAQAAPGSRIVHYFAPDSTDGWIHAFAEAIHDREYRPSVISVSWGSPEILGDSQFYAAVNDQLRSAALLGITICCATGDSGAAANGVDRSVSFPASSPYVLAVGGSELAVDQNEERREITWNRGLNAISAGGMSQLFRSPSWQQHTRYRLHAAAEYKNCCSLTTSQLGGGRPRRRILPDVCAHAAGVSYFVTPRSVPGAGAPGAPEPVEASGTSAAAPLWAALVVRINGALRRRVGLVTPLLYRKAVAAGLRDVQLGQDGAFIARDGWDACTGLGSPDGERLVRILRSGTARVAKRSVREPASAIKRTRDRSRIRRRR